MKWKKIRKSLAKAGEFNKTAAIVVGIGFNFSWICNSQENLIKEMLDEIER